MTLESTFQIASQASLPLNLTYFEVESLAGVLADTEKFPALLDHLVSFLQSNGSSETGNYRLNVDEVKQVARECF